MKGIFSMKRMRSRSLLPAILTVEMLLLTQAYVFAADAPLPASRKTIFLDGRWQIAEGSWRRASFCGRWATPERKSCDGSVLAVWSGSWGSRDPETTQPD
jgi:hypothetical protein